MGTCQTSSNVQTRGQITIIYSSTSGTSKNAASKLQQLLEEQKYLAPVINIGDFDTDDYIDYCGTIIFLLSTYGDGASPIDGENFLTWIEKLQVKEQFAHIEYCILAFGNSSFDNHCGFGLRTEKVLKAGGAKALVELTMCDAKENDRNFDAKFPKWSKQLIQILNFKNHIREMPRSNLGSAYQATIENKPNYEWQPQAKKVKNIGKQFSNFLNMHKCRVIHIKQLRKKCADGRSTLWIRLEIDPSIQLTPACNIDVFPMNSIQLQCEDCQVVTFSQLRGKVPFPSMPLGQIRRLLNYNQNASNKQIKNAVLLSVNSQQVALSYNKRLKEKQQIKVTCKKLIEDLKPRVEFLPEIGLNRVRTYTLASWDPEHKYVDLCVSLVKNGLTSEYLKTKPDYIRISSIGSTFYLPQNRPIVMIANGSGIAPFRSLTQYYASLPKEQRVPLRLYYGIQNAQVDYYFDEDWKDMQNKGIVELRIAQSRKQGSKKQYVQDVLDKDVDWLKEHLFTHNGVIFICGGLQMSKSVNNVIFKSLTAHVKMAYKAFSLSGELKLKKTIVEQVFG